MARSLAYSSCDSMFRRFNFQHACIFCLIAMFAVKSPFFCMDSVGLALLVRAESRFAERNLALNQPSSSPFMISLKNEWWNQPSYPPTKDVSTYFPSLTVSSSNPSKIIESSTPTLLVGTEKPSLNNVPSISGQTSSPSIQIPIPSPQSGAIPSVAPTVALKPAPSPSISPSQLITTSSPTTQVPNQLSSFTPTTSPQYVSAVPSTISKPQLSPSQPSSMSPNQLITAVPMTQAPSRMPSLAPTSAQIGDGWCDSGDLNLPNLNTADCNYDGGDCCLATCKADTSFACGTAGFNCQNPSYSSQMRSSNFSLLFLIANFTLVSSNDGLTPDEKATEVAISGLTYIAIKQQPAGFLGSISSKEVSVISHISTVLTSFDGRLVGDVEVVITTYFNATHSNQLQLKQQQQHEEYTPSTIEFNLERSFRYAAQVLVLPSLTNVIVCSNRTAVECIARAEPASSLVVTPNDNSVNNASVCSRSEGMWQTWYGSPRSLPAYLVLLMIFSTTWVIIMLTLFGCITLLSKMWGKGLTAPQNIRNLTWVILSLAAVLRFLCNVWILEETDLFIDIRDGSKLVAAACYEFAYLGSNDQSGIGEINLDTMPLFVLGLTLFYCVFAAVSLLRSLQRVMEQNMSFERQRSFFANLFVASMILCILILLNVISAVLWAAGVYSSRSSVVLVIIALTQAVCGIIIMLYSLATSSAESAVLCAIGILYIITSYPDVVRNASAAFWLSSLLCRVLEILWAMLYLKSVLNIGQQRRRDSNGIAPTVVHAVPILKKNSAQDKKNWQRQRMARYILVSDRIIDDLEECNHPEWIQEWIAQDEEKDAFTRM